MSDPFKRNAGIPLKYRPTPAELVRFLKKIRVNESGCWVWGGYRDKKGYGKFKCRGVSHWAARWSRQAFRGAFPPGHEADHKDACRNPSCVNPDHIGPMERLAHCRDSAWKRDNLNKPPRKRKPRPLPPIPDDGIPI